MDTLEAVVERLDTVELDDQAELLEQRDEHGPDQGGSPEFEEKRAGDGDADNRFTFEDLKLPEVTIIRIMKEVLPSNTIISKEAKTLFARLSTFFILYLTDCASAVSSKKKRKTVMPDDILTALKEGEYEQFADVLSSLLEARKHPKGQSSSARTVSPERVGYDTENALSDLVDQLEVDDQDVVAVSPEAEPLDQTQEYSMVAESPADQSTFNEAFNASDDED